MKTILYCFTILLLVATAAHARDLYPLDNAFREDSTSISERVALLKSLGYPGIVTEQKTYTEEWGRALKEEGLDIYATYLVLKPGKKGIPVPAAFLDHIALFAGTDTQIWVTVAKHKKFEADESAVLEAIVTVADAAKASGLKTVIYPHYSFHTDTMETVLRLAGSANRKDLGVAFTLCHYLKQENPDQLESALRTAAPHLMAVQVNGADTHGKSTGDWTRLIMPLDQGDFDMQRVLDTLDAIGYPGAVTLQCFGLGVGAEDHLPRSAQAWNTITAQ
ncbi:MAG: TIM barrel protein [Verrucomicrobiota bacterium]